MEKIADIIFIGVVFLAIGCLFASARKQNKAIKVLFRYFRDLEDKLNTINYNQANQVLNYLKKQKELTEEDKFVMERCNKLIADYERIYKTPQG